MREPGPGVSVSDVERRLEVVEAALTEALRHQEALQGELDITRDEMNTREQIARQEALALQKAIAERGVTPTPMPTQPKISALDFERISREVEQRIGEIERRVAAAGESVRSLAPRPESAAGSPANGSGIAGAATPVRKPAVPESTPKPETQPLLEINRISFEQLRELGLTVSQAARLLARRDAQGGYTSIDQLIDVVDFPPAVIDRIRASVRVG